MAEKPILCATIEAYECSQGEQCLMGEASNINAPQFIRLNLVEKMAQAERPDGEAISSEIRIATQSDDHVILQGAQDDRGWSMRLDMTSGQMSLTASGDRIAFVLFGACTGI